MTYTTGVPFDGQSLGNSKPQVRDNFNIINTAFSINHIAFGSTGQGKHKFLQMPEQGSAPTTVVNEGGLYSKEASGITNLFWRQESNGTEIQLTNIAPSNASSGYTFLPGGILMQWDTVTTGGSTTNVVFPVPFTAATTPYSIQLTWGTSISGFNATLSVSSGSVTNTGFTLRTQPALSAPVYYVAIGKKT